MIVQPTTLPEIDTMIKQLPNKTSYGHDKISNTMLKALRTSITYPLCHIFNASLSEGSFPEQMKTAGQGHGLNDKLQTNLTTNYVIQIIGKSDVHKTVWLFGIAKAVIPEPIWF